MDIKEFAKQASVATTTGQLGRLELLVFFCMKTRNQEKFTVSDAIGWFDEVGLPKPNPTILRARLGKSREFVGGKTGGVFRLHPVQVARLEETYPDLDSTAIAEAKIDTVLPRDLLQNTRGFVESLSKQINLSFESHIYDGCAMLMRHLLEILLVLAFRELGLEQYIINTDGGYVELKKIIDLAVASPVLKLSKTTKKYLPEFRELGNLSAHSVEFNCRKSDIANRALSYRAIVEELAYRAALKK